VSLSLSLSLFPLTPPIGCSTSLSTTVSLHATAASHKRLDQFNVCDMCSGSGEQREMYHFMQRSVTCTACHGDGIVRRAPYVASPAARTGRDGVAADDGDVPPLEEA
jgi:DnaJ-class molecular chaperone